MKNYYAILGVEKGVSDEDLRKAYLKQAQIWHPDKHHGKDTAEEAGEKFKDIGEAYENLQKGIGSSEDSGSRHFRPTDIEDMLRDLARKGGFNFGGSQQVEFYEQVNVPVTTENLYNEEEIIVKFQTYEKDEVSACTTCGGKGRVTTTTLQGNVQIFSESPCHTCRGQGFKATGVGTEKEFKVVPAIENLQFARPLGKVGSYNPTSNDYNKVQVKFDLQRSSNYHIVENGLGLMMTLPVLYEHLKDGKKLRISVFGNNITVDIPAKPSMQRMVVVAGKGMPNGNGGRGNLYVKLDLKYKKE